MLIYTLFNTNCYYCKLVNIAARQYLIPKINIYKPSISYQQFHSQVFFFLNSKGINLKKLDPDNPQNIDHKNYTHIKQPSNHIFSLLFSCLTLSDSNLIYIF